MTPEQRLSAAIETLVEHFRDLPLDFVELSAEKVRAERRMRDAEARDHEQIMRQVYAQVCHEEGSAGE